MTAIGTRQPEEIGRVTRHLSFDADSRQRQVFVF